MYLNSDIHNKNWKFIHLYEYVHTYMNTIVDISETIIYCTTLYIFLNALRRK